ncbi:unnamed protein product, partial [Amoebophrya sp. A120]|eukprot:GSA120T00000329001.1
MNLRENWAQPVLAMQIFFLLRFFWQSELQRVVEKSCGAAGRHDQEEKNPVRINLAHTTSFKTTQLLFATTTLASLLVWQFTPFVLTLQGAAVYFVYICRGISFETFAKLLNLYFLAYASAIVLFSGSELILSSLFLSQLLAFRVVVWVFRDDGSRSKNKANYYTTSTPPTAGEDRSSSTSCADYVTKFRFRFFQFFKEGLLAVFVFCVLRFFISKSFTGDAHILEIFCAKAEYEAWPCPATRTFNARLYLVMGVFHKVAQDVVDFFHTTYTVQLCLAGATLLLLQNLWHFFVDPVLRVLLFFKKNKSGTMWNHEEDTKFVASSSSSPAGGHGCTKTGGAEISSGSEYEEEEGWSNELQHLQTVDHTKYTALLQMSPSVKVLARNLRRDLFTTNAYGPGIHMRN